MVIKLCDIFNADTRGVIHTRDHGYYTHKWIETLWYYILNSYFILFFFCFEN